MPKGVLAIVFGVPHEVSMHLIASPIIRKVSFTGSIPVGKQLVKLAADGMKRTTMELGGHAPVLVFDDVDVDKVLDMCVAAKYRNAGQVCVSPTRFYVQESIYQRFAEGFAARARALPVGDGIDEANRMGPLAHARRLPAVQGIIDEALQHGARLLAGGKRIARKGYFFEPTVLADVPNSARIMNEEPFGPIAILNPFRDFDAVMAEANRLPYGLAAFGFTNNAQRVNLLGERLEAGMIGLNSFQISVPESPFGGMKESGHGSEEGIEGLEACLVTKFISQSSSANLAGLVDQHHVRQRGAVDHVGQVRTEADAHVERRRRCAARWADRTASCGSPSRLTKSANLSPRFSMPMRLGEIVDQGVRALALGPAAAADAEFAVLGQRALLGSLRQLDHARAHAAPRPPAWSRRRDPGGSPAPPCDRRSHWGRGRRCRRPARRRRTSSSTGSGIRRASTRCCSRRN